ncbi:MAG: hydantoinase B/oxoprolinase family protein [Opitutaceae bacterium]
MTRARDLEAIGRVDAIEYLPEIGGVHQPEWTLFIDTGGTFTDCIGRSPDGSIHRCKVLSSSGLRGRVARLNGTGACCLSGLPDLPQDFFRGFRLFWPGREDAPLRVHAWDPETRELRVEGHLPTGIGPGSVAELRLEEEAPILAARVLTRTPGDRVLPPLAMRLATTRGTNALLEEKGVPPLLLINAGLEDLLVIGDQRRPDLFALNPRRPAPLHGPVVPVSGRLEAGGGELVPIVPSEIERIARPWFEKGHRTAAVCLLHSYGNPAHEQAVADCLRAIGFTHVSVSSDLAPVIKIVPRCETTVVDAYLAPIMNAYLDAVGSVLDRDRLHVMTSAGGLVTRSAYRPKDSLLSGPAGGVVATAAIARRARHPRVIAFDMGGTSTDVARYDGEFDYRYRQTVGRATVFAPGLKIESVAAGGGSICRFDGHVLTVGPDSAGASPGPACYGAGGPFTLTDVNLLLGRMDPDLFSLPVFPEQARSRLDEIHRQIEEATGRPTTDGTILQGFLAIANERMAEAVRRISIREGYDCSGYSLLAFGGGGGLHACGVARSLGIRVVLYPGDSGLLSALGLKEAVLERFAVEQILQPIEEIRPDLAGRIAEVGRRAVAEVVREGVDPSEVVLRFVRAEMRFEGQEDTLTVPADRVDLLVRRFKHRHRKRYGHCPSNRPVELVALRAVASGRANDPDRHESFRRRQRLKAATGGERPVLRERASLGPGDVLAGPAIVQDRFSTLFIEKGWTGVVGDLGSIRMVEDAGTDSGHDVARSGESIVALELVSNRLGAIVEDMGELLQRTALSTNMKERLDFSCGLLDAEGRLVVNAPHIPVHLGALGLCVRRVTEEIDWRPGDAVVTNHPGFGGSHLPDVTLITPVFSDDGVLRAFVANRAHHAEIGGIRPGSMPPDARNLEEEGVVIPPIRVAHRGRVDWSPLERLLREARFPSRSPEENLADLDAQMAANRAAALELGAMIAGLGKQRFADSLKALAERADDLVRQRFSEIRQGALQAEEFLDDGTPLKVAIQVEPEGIRVDFSGSGGLHPGNLNATPAVVRSALLYVLRLFVRTEVPLNEGLLNSVRSDLPPGLLNPSFAVEASRCPPVVGGNVETSQRVVDLLIKALGLAACSQGTMNNLIFGTSRGSYYETIAGGAGAGPGSAGSDAIHTHMTNTAITDPEILEWRHPVRLHRFGVRFGSGGGGQFRGGNGVIREIEFLEPAELSLLTQHRVVAPYGMAGGSAGECGRQWIIRADGRVEVLPSIAAADLGSGDRLVIETPGGGGWGRKG